MAQPDGSYPRVNAAMLQTGQYNGMIVSLVGKVRGNDGTHIKFESADGGLVQVSLEQADFPAGLAGDAVLELVGLAGSPQELTLFVVRELTPDTNLEVYNKMLMVQKKFPQYFAPLDPNTVGSPMATN